VNGTQRLRSGSKKNIRRKGDQFLRAFAIERSIVASPTVAFFEQSCIHGIAAARCHRRTENAADISGQHGKECLKPFQC
jgi:hypothetical protein